MLKLIAVVMMAAAPLVAAAPSAAATAGHRAADSGDAAVVIVGIARGGLAHPPAAPPAPQVRDAATPRQPADTRAGGQTAVLTRHGHGASKTASACVGAPAAPIALASPGSALARAPPASA